VLLLSLSAEITSPSILSCSGCAVPPRADENSGGRLLDDTEALI
jgi:hypothetical protein